MCFVININSDYFNKKIYLYKECRKIAKIIRKKEKMIIRLNKDIYYYHYIRLEKLTKNIYRENDPYKKDKLYDRFFLMYEDRNNKIKVKKECFKSLIRDLEKYKDLKS